MKNGTHYRTCNLCEAMCGVAIEVEDGAISRIQGDDQDPFSRGHICPKALGLKDIHEDPDRLRHPVRRTRDGWETISWEQAFREVTNKLSGIQASLGRNAVGLYLGNPNVHNHGALMANGIFMGALGTQNRFSATSNDQLPHMLANLQMFGNAMLFPIPDIDHTDLFICLGANPMASNGSLMTVPDFRGRLKELQQRGGRFIVIDPRRSETAAKADDFHFIRPGTDPWLLLAMLNVLFEADALDPDVCRQHQRDARILQLAAMPYRPEDVADRTGLNADAIRDLALEFARTPRALLYSRVGTSTQQFGGLATWLVYALNILTGKLDREGGLRFTEPAVDLVTLGSLSGQTGHYGRRHTRVRGLPEFGGEFPANAMAEEMLTPGDGQIRAFVTVAGNPVLSSPSGERMDEALSGLEFMVSVDYYINETTRHADIILPPTAPLERSHYDLAFNTLAVRNVAKFSDPLFTPAPDTRSDWDILVELAHRLERAKKGSSLRGELGWRTLKALGPDRILDLMLRAGPYGTSPEPLRPALQSLTDLGDRILPEGNPFRALLRNTASHSHWKGRPKGLSLDYLRRQPHGVDLGPLQPTLPGRLQTRSGRPNLAPELYLQDMPRLHKSTAPTDADSHQSFYLIGRRQLRSNNSWMHNSQRLMKGKARCTLQLHPRDLAGLGLIDGHNARVSSESGTITLPVESTDAVMPGVVSIPHGWGHGRDGIQLSVARTQPGASINDVISDRQVDTLSGVSVLNGQRVTVSVARSE